MNKRLTLLVLIALLTSLILAGCAPAPTPEPTATPTATTAPTATSTPTPTITPTPTATVPPTMTATPVSDFLTKYMKLPVMQVVDIRVDVKGSKVTAVFYLEDVPDEIFFNRSGTPANSMEYSWGIYIDKDNDTTTGDTGFNGTGADEALIAYSIFTNMGDQDLSQPIEEGVRTSVWFLEGNNMNSSSEGQITVDPEANTIVLQGSIDGITPDSVFYYQVNDANPNGIYQQAGGKLADRVTFISE